jgi:cytochrome c
MTDQSQITKIGATLFGAVLFYGFIYMLSNSLFATHPATAVTVDANGKPVAAVAAPAAPAADAAAASAEATEAPAAEVPVVPAFVEVDPATVIGDATAGEQVFTKNCKTCHKIDGKNAIGPHLNGVVGRATATVEGFKYSVAMKGHVGNWTPERLDIYLVSPKAEVSGTRMSFAGLKDGTDRANIIAFLYSLGQK